MWFFLGDDFVTESHWNQFSLELGTSATRKQALTSHDKRGSGKDLLLNEIFRVSKVLLLAGFLWFTVLRPFRNSL